MGPNDDAERRIRSPVPVISVHVEVARLAGGSSAAARPRLTSRRCYGPVEGASFASADNGLDLPERSVASADA